VSSDNFLEVVNHRVTKDFETVEEQYTIDVHPYIDAWARGPLA